MNDGKPLVTILINNYNYGRFLREAIDSALNQTYPHTEVIVVDDGSTDDSREIIASYGHRIIPVLKVNGGQSSAFNAGFAASHGAWIFLLDSDDIFLSVKTQEVLKLAKQNPLAGLIAHNLEYCDACGGPIDFLPPPIREHKLVDDRRRVRQGKVTVLLPATSGLCFRRSVLGQVLPMPEELQGQPDNYVKFVALSLATALLAPESLAIQRIHDRNHYTSCCKDSSEGTRLRQLRLSAEVGYHLRRDHPLLSRLAWKQYGRILYQLASAKSEKARAVKAEIKERYSVVDRSLTCFFYVAAAFTKASVKGLLQGRFDG